MPLLALLLLNILFFWKSQPSDSKEKKKKQVQMLKGKSQIQQPTKSERTNQRKQGNLQDNIKIQQFPSTASIGLPGWLRSKESAWNAGAIGGASLIPGLGRSPGGGNGNPLQYSCLENPMDRGIQWATVHRIAKIWTWKCYETLNTKNE